VQRQRPADDAVAGGTFAAPVLQSVSRYSRDQGFRTYRRANATMRGAARALHEPDAPKALVLGVGGQKFDTPKAGPTARRRRGQGAAAARVVAVVVAAAGGSTAGRHFDVVMLKRES
jgi:hypothetical protein